MYRKVIVASLIFLTFLIATTGQLRASENDIPEPQKKLEKGIQNILQVLEDTPVYSNADLQQLRPKIEEIAETLFAFTEITLRTLGRHARDISDTQLEKLVPLYQELLENIVLNSLTPIVEKSDQPLPIPTVKFKKSEVRKSGGTPYAQVFTTAIINQPDKEKMKVKLNFKMVKRKGSWFIYDLVIEGVSMIQNYRSQFAQIIARSSVDGLISTLQEKIEQLRSKPGKARQEVEEFIPSTEETDE